MGLSLTQRIAACGCYCCLPLCSMNGNTSDEDATDSDEDVRPRYGIRRVKRGFLLNAFTTLNVVCVLVALGVIVAQILVIAYVKTLTPVSIAVRCYCVVFCLVIICAEMEWTQPVRELSVFSNWVPRGFLYAFIGALTLEMQEEKDLKDYEVAVLYIYVMGWIMVVVGALYFLMGICCLHKLKQRRLDRYRTLMNHMENRRVIEEDFVRGP
eukprot:TRINITY_DN1779_c0_g1_i2.p1 TRINITY_DN1779_c0_g1~~TRINITY_DN1779_c0_g1_i2.p1  ORF type:complete len:211 (+),score=35.62 TRINITY_DN1779_c0_g1_i2:766-1398(+)